MEINTGKLDFKVGGFVAVAASDGTMRSCQREFCLGMVKARQLHPGFVGVTSFTSHGLPVDQPEHALSELPAVRILVTTRAGHVLKVVPRRRFVLRGSLGLRFVTLLASHGQMRSGQHEPWLLVPRQAERRRLVTIERVALLTTVQIRCGRKLRLVFVFVAIETATEFDFV
jgi:hypothetical protein